MVEDWRTSRKAKTFHRIQEEAMRLFLAQGYDATTVEEIAAAAGVSHMTVFRHFPTKEALVLTDEYDPLIADAIRKGPPTESALDSVEHAIIEVLGRVLDADVDLLLQRTGLIWSTPSLQAGVWTNWLETQQVIASALADRGEMANDPLSIRIGAGIALITAATASQVWIEEEGRRPFKDVVIDAFAAARRQVVLETRPHEGSRPDDSSGLVKRAASANSSAPLPAASSGGARS